MFINSWNWMLDFKYNNLAGFILYWIPFLFCVYGFTIRSIKEYKKDIKNRVKYNTYCPTITIGDIMCRIFWSIIPILNILNVIFNLAPEIFSDIFTLIHKFFDIPLVPEKEKENK